MGGLKFSYFFFEIPIAENGRHEKTKNIIPTSKLIREVGDFTEFLQKLTHQHGPIVESRYDFFVKSIIST